MRHSLDEVHPALLVSSREINGNPGALCYGTSDDDIQSCFLFGFAIIARVHRDIDDRRRGKRRTKVGEVCRDISGLISGFREDSNGLSRSGVGGKTVEPGDCRYQDGVCVRGIAGYVALGDLAVVQAEYSDDDGS